MNSLHPCFNAAAHTRFGRVHLPVAPRCNITCGFCDRRYSCVNESRPGVTAQVICPEEACAQACRAVAAARAPITVAGIAGPGDPLANPDETLDTLRRVHAALPELLLCLSTNGLALPTYAGEIAALGVGHVTVTVNAVSPAMGARVYCEVRDDDRILQGEDAAALLLERQEAGVRLLKAAGVTVKINTVIVPSVNAEHAVDIARTVADWGADVMNCIGLLPVAGTPLARHGSPAPEVLAAVRASAEQFLPQMRHCARCRADACGLLHSDGLLNGGRAAVGL